jgi:hypothetical protein
MHEWQTSKLDPLALLQSILNHCLPNSTIFHVHGSFGDVYLQLAAIKVSIIIDERYSQLAQVAATQDTKIIFAPGEYVNKLLTKLGLLGRSKTLPIRLLSTIYPMIPELILEDQLQQAAFLRQLVWSEKVGPFTKIENYDVLREEAEKIILEAGGKPGRSILVSADNNTQREFDENFWYTVCQKISSRGWTPILNSSGTLSNREPNILRSADLIKIKVPPHLATTIVTSCGGYITGTNGFATIQALFNHRTSGFHVINGDTFDGKYIYSKMGVRGASTVYPHATSYKHEFLGLMKESIIYNSKLTESDWSILDELLC